MRPKEDSFSPKRHTNIDGFFTGPAAERPRQSVFQANQPKPRMPGERLAAMPQRGQPTRSSSGTSAFGAELLPSAQNAQSKEVDTPGGEPRRRGRRGEGAGGQSTGKKRRSWKRISKRAGIGLGVLVLLAGAWFGFKFYKDIAKVTGNKNPLALLSVFHPVPLKNQDGRVNILLAGNSADDPGHNGANLTDSIMVLSVDTKNNTALMLSIPRDLWVNIPGVGYSKINAAYPNGGMDLLQKVIEKNLGFTIDYQVLVNYEAFKDLVNALGGITITIKSDDPRGIYDPNIDYTSRTCCALAKYPNGPVTLNGQQALNLARARGDPSRYGIPYGFSEGDFDRTEHQRQMLQAIKDKASKASIIANPFKVSALVDAVGKNITTSLKLNEVETLYTYMKKIPDSQIASYNINTLKGKDTTMLANYTSPNGQSALIPAAGLDDFSDIQAQIKKILSSDPVAREGATVEVLNGTSVTGLASQQVNSLIAKGMMVTVGDAPAAQATSTIIDNSSGQMPNTLAYLKKKYSATVTTNTSLTATYPNADFILILGQSAAPKASSTTGGQ